MHLLARLLTSLALLPAFAAAAETAPAPAALPVATPPAAETAANDILEHFVDWLQLRFFPDGSHGELVHGIAFGVLLLAAILLRRFITNIIFSWLKRLAAKTETTTGNVWSYTYDIRNRMTGVTEKNSGGTVIYQASYTYDALDRRIATTVNGTTTWTVYDGQNTYADFSGAGVLKTRYLYGPAVDALLARTDASGTTAWYLTDRLGSVRDLASTSGGLLDHLAYDAYGNIVSESNPTNGDRFKWTAREWDGTTGLQFNRHRYYTPSVGRWTQLDPIGFKGDDQNL